MTTQEEAQKLYQESLLDQQKEELEKNRDLINNFKSETQQKGIKLFDTNFSYIYTIGIIATYPNLVSYLSPGLVKDKEGLNNFKYLNSIFIQRPYAKGFLYSDIYMVMASPFFRRGFHQNSNFAP